MNKNIIKNFYSIILNILSNRNIETEYYLIYKKLYIKFYFIITHAHP